MTSCSTCGVDIIDNLKQRDEVPHWDDTEVLRFYGGTPTAGKSLGQIVYTNIAVPSPDNS